MTGKCPGAYQYLLQNGFSPAGRESYPLFQNFRHDSELAEKTAAVWTAWSAPFNELYKMIDGYLCTAFFFPGMSAYFEINRPLENCEYPLKHIVDILYGLARKAELPFLQLYAVDERFLAEYTSIPGYAIQSEYSDDHSEYVYPVKELLELSGGANLNRRTRLKKYFDNPAMTLVPMTNKNKTLCLEIQEIWCRERDCVRCSSFAGCEKTAVEMMIHVFDEATHQGLYLYHNDKAAGYIIGEKKNERIAYVYFGKAVIQDGFVYLVYMAAKKYYGDVCRLNINEDMGSAGIRTFKKHLGPHELWRKYTCIYTKGESDR